MHDEFVDSTFGSHHMRLANHVAALFNAVREKQPSRVKAGLHPMNSLLIIDSGEVFGLVSSPHTASYGGLLEISKDEPILDSEMDLFIEEIDARTAEMDTGSVFQDTIEVTEPRLGDSLRKGKRKALEILGIDSIERSPDPTQSQSPLNASESATVPLADKRRRLDQPHLPHRHNDVPTVNDHESAGIMSWLHNHDGDNLPVRNHAIY